MRLKQTMENLIDTESVNKISLSLAKISLVDTTKETCDVILDKDGVFRHFYAVPYPRGVFPKSGMLCIMGYVDNNILFPVILNIFSESLLFSVPREDEIPVGNPLYIGSI